MIRGRLAGAVGGLLLGTLAAPAAASEPFGSGAAGGGYDSNLNAATSAGDAEGSGFVFATAAAGLATAPADVRYQVALRWEGVSYAEYPDLSSNGVALAAGAFARLSEGLLLTAEPSVGGSFHGDADRDSLDLAVRLGLRWSLHERLALRPGYAFLWEEARESPFDRNAHRLSLGLDADLWPGGRARVAYALELGEVVRYLDVVADGGDGGPGGMDVTSGRPTDVFGPLQVADRESATISEVTLGLEQELTPWLFLRAGGGYAHVSADPDDYEVLFGSASLGVRFR